ncbi:MULTISPECIES: hypothetical protein [unclassified Duganella]|jgi:hypothetical protein|uniref:hypothetical protein n=1 Tax=unclassified Duganella TaxID=2636909 RepID=UPI0008904B5A|nr:MULTISPECIES: hypothetical protein [unclassified Duganella]SDH44272.1 hypothetical protein SAMN05216320_113104 [Duganella sp. OV458]SDK58244.1 hypothetical protein SAMN05428973_11358 [Duganella sp. OV510]
MVTYFAQLQSNPGWFAINVLVPVLLPFAVIATVAIATGGWREFLQMMKKAVDNGQLFWVALAMLASTGYEAFATYGRSPDTSEAASWALGACIIGAVFTSIFIAINTSRIAQGQDIRKRVIWISILLTIASSYFYPWFHFIFGS